MRRKKESTRSTTGRGISFFPSSPARIFSFDYCSFYWVIQGGSAEERGCNPKHASLKERGSRLIRGNTKEWCALWSARISPLPHHKGWRRSGRKEWRKTESGKILFALSPQSEHPTGYILTVSWCKKWGGVIFKLPLGLQFSGEIFVVCNVKRSRQVKRPSNPCLCK